MKKLFRKRGFRGLLFLTLSGLLSSPMASALSTNELIDNIQGFEVTNTDNQDSEANKPTDHIN